MERIITNSMIGDFESYLRSDEKSDNTIEKYLRDVRAFTVFTETREINKAVHLHTFVRLWSIGSPTKQQIPSTRKSVAFVNTAAMPTANTKCRRTRN